jgi:transcriptional regulator GlxA family with amidase domain
VNHQPSQRPKPNQPRQKRVVILGLPPVDALDVIGPAEVFTVANKFSAGPTPPYVLELVSASDDSRLDSITGIALMAHKTLEQERRDNLPIDTLIVATGWDPNQVLDPAALAWIAERAPEVRRVCSICVAAFALAAAGLLDGRRAATHWGVAQELAERYPKIEVDADPIWIKDGNVYTSAGISAGVDLALALVSEDLGDELALQIARHLVLFLRRPGGQAQFSVTLQSQRAAGSALEALCLWIGEHLQSDITVELLADRMSTSVRTLIRMFQRDLNTTPAKYVEDVRLEAARRGFELGDRSVEEIARRCGYGSVDVMRKVFVRRLGVTPREYAMRFAPVRARVPA